MRVEDTDKERSTKAFEKNITDGLKWLGINWDNSKIIRQSERLDIYRPYLQQLLDGGQAFWCHHTVEELVKEKDQQIKNKEPQRHLCDHKNAELARQPGQVIRLNIPWDSERKVKFDDLIRGTIEYDERLLGDMSIAKNLDTPLYNFAVVVDDFEMKITHVIRGEDHISNTPKQILIYSALGLASPQFGHLPLILAADRSKLSKRHGAVSVEEYEKDYLPEALINFMGFLGYTYSKELLTMEEMAQEFDITKVHKSGAIFDTKKLNWLNAQYVRKLDPVIFKRLAKVPRLPDAAIVLATERLEKLSDAKEFEYFWKKPAYDKELLSWKDSAPHIVQQSLIRSREILEQWDFENTSALRSELDESAGGRPAPDGSAHTSNRGLVYWPLRVALSGKKASPDPVDIARALGKKEALARVDAAIKKLGGSKKKAEGSA